MPRMTASQKREQSKVEYNAFLAECPSRQLLERISDKWVALVLAALVRPDSLRYSEIARRIPGVSQKMLTQTLRSLEQDGLITRAVTPTVPVTVTYALTDLGRSLQELMVKVKAWAEDNMDEVLANRSAHDTAQSEMTRTRR